MYQKPRDRLLQFLARGRKQFFQEFWALNDISLNVAKGETFAILGRNGSGKSTLLQIIAGTLSPTQGDVQISGKLAALLELGSGFNPEFTGRENVYLNGAILGFSQKEMADHFEEITAFADIGAHLDQPVKTYSSGMYVRLAFAVQACVSPDILIVDEALSVGDEKFQRKCFDYIDKLRANGCAILLVTHSTSTVEKFCQRAALLHKGHMHGLGPAKEIVDQYHALLYSDERTYLRYLNAEKIQKKPAFEGHKPSTQKSTTLGGEDEANSRTRAVIHTWEVYDPNGDESEVFYSGQKLNIKFNIDIFKAIPTVQAGLLIRTVEGVAVFGTSSLYHQSSYTDARPGDRLTAEFHIELALCEGTYFVTLAAAEEISHSDMTYLDRKTDVIILKVQDPRKKGTGLAALNASVSIS
ncbi:MAG: ABC transporter ATP-binding protein [Pseudomonadales bacterium]